MITFQNPMDGNYIVGHETLGQLDMGFSAPSYLTITAILI